MRLSVKTDAGQGTSRKRVYLAGPEVFLPDPDRVARALKERCAAHGLEGVFPLDAGLALNDLTAAGQAQAIFNANIDLIRGCDGVIANMTPFRGPSMDVGTAFEMGFAAALGKPVIGYTDDLGEYVDRVVTFYRGHVTREGCAWRDPDGLTIEDFSQVDNLMMCGAALAITRDFDQALLAMRGVFGHSLACVG
ncbi:nucleoside 2-deoxyribosyltransferase [Pararhodospirillum photometricum]|uniref:Nucleoside 2-deoxyribosyltransferase n=1 Tax=Pararhodospirillum photometricum DSM 122 TaxID=1150469 RepID=H6SL28_PARPM|nr:nucleoside 2-deoxyribosyltransferase [Pararhodospirillum photometricum]CCG08693.1 Nucleoside 2-deoxyribosyltransferase [Pararhodospirillum photometricum DSM 122]